MSTVKIELNRSEVGRLLKSAEVHADIARRCAAIAAAASSGGGTFGHDVVTGSRRVHGMVWTDDFAAMETEATTRALTRAIDAGRG